MGVGRGLSVVVVGAGISGLSAARELRRAGLAVRLFEAADRPGGRIRSLRVNGCVLEVGPGVVASTDTLVHDLAQVARVPLRPVRPGMATVRDGRLHAFRPDRPWSVLSSGALPARAAVGAARAGARLQWQARGRRAADPAAWADLDDRTARQLADEVGCPDLGERLWAPIIHGSWLADLDATSGALVRAMTAHGLWHAMLTVDGGLSVLTDALGGRLGAECGVPVTAVRAGRHGVEVRAGNGALRADGVVLAVPGPVAATLLEDAAPPDDHGSLRNVDDRKGGEASSTLVVGLGVHRRLAGRELGGASRVLIHPGDGPLAALHVASRAQQAPKHADLVTCLFTPADAARLMDAAPARILAEAHDALLRWAPTLADSLCTDEDGGVRVERVPRAMPLCPPGRAGRIAAHHDQESGPIALAGDDLAWPWADSSALTGRRAAGDLLRRLAV